MRRIATRSFLLLLGLATLLAGTPATSAEVPHVLVFSGTYGFRHPIITQSNIWLQEMADGTGAFTVEITENPADLNADKLAGTDIVLWNSSTGKTPLTDDQRSDIVRWAWCGGGTIGVHASADSNYAWEEYAELLGAQFDSHPQNAGNGENPVRLVVENPEHPANRAWLDQNDVFLEEELYRWRRSPRGFTPDTEVLMSLDETSVSQTIQEGATPYEHLQPIAWAKTFRGGGRVFYTNLGHGGQSWDTPEFRLGLIDAIRWVSKVRPDQDCLDASDPVPPPPGPPQPDPEAEVEPCEVPVVAERSGFTWQTNGPAKRLTEEGDTMTMPGAGVPGGLAWTEQTYVLDLSAGGARTAEVVFDLGWSNPVNDFDLSVTTPWGWEGSDARQPLAAAGEQVVIEGVPHCSLLHVYAENSTALGESPTLTAVVTPGESGSPGA